MVAAKSKIREESHLIKYESCVCFFFAASRNMLELHSRNTSGVNLKKIQYSISAPSHANNPSATHTLNKSKEEEEEEKKLNEI